MVATGKHWSGSISAVDSCQVITSRAGFSSVQDFGHSMSVQISSSILLRCSRGCHVLSSRTAFYGLDLRVKLPCFRAWCGNCRNLAVSLLPVRLAQLGGVVASLDRGTLNEGCCHNCCNTDLVVPCFQEPPLWWWDRMEPASLRHGKTLFDGFLSDSAQCHERCCHKLYMPVVSSTPTRSLGVLVRGITLLWVRPTFCSVFGRQLHGSVWETRICTRRVGSPCTVLSGCLQRRGFGWQ